MRKYSRLMLLVIVAELLIGCATTNRNEKPLVPAIEYARRINSRAPSTLNAHEIAQHRVEELNHEISGSRDSAFPDQMDRENPQDMRAALDPRSTQNLQPYGPPELNPRDYNGPLSLGDPGQASSLWRESGSGHDFFRDVRAWQPMDLITVRILEKTEGKKEADTETKGKSSLSASIDKFLGFEDKFPGTDPLNALSASTQNDYKGEGETTRKDSLTGSLSAMVVEVLPTGIIRIEGTKIISVNNEEQIMVLTGLVRPRDISSDNEVDSTRVANMRIDYYGRGDIGDVQRQGWLGQFVRKVWPF